MKPERQDELELPLRVDRQPQPEECSDDPVQRAEWESFPASDPPSWWSG
jgi:hypothetical protein